MKFAQSLIQFPLIFSLFLIPTCSFADSSPLEDEYLQLANTFRDEGNHDKAGNYYQKALDINSSNFLARFNYANLLYSQDKMAQAIEQYQKVIEIKADCAPAHFNLGVCYGRQNMYDKAAKAYEKTIQFNPQHIKAYQQLVLVLIKENKHKEALVYAKKALDLEPHDFETLWRTGQCYRQLDKFEESVPYFRKAVELDSKNIHAILDLANILNMVEETDEAIVWYQRILEINPKINEALYNLGFTLKKQGHIKEAMEIYHKLLELKPNYAQPHFSLSLSYLTLGDWDKGWKEYEWRWAAYNETPRKLKQPTWEGQDLQGKTILLYAEQGLGDSIQFIRYAKLLKEKGATVFFDVQKPLKQILSLCPYIDKVYGPGDTLPSFDYQIPLMSLPMVFKTTIETTPHEIPYLYADSKLIEYWKEKLSHDKNFKIGICWQGNANYSTQFLRKTVAAKSMHVREFAPIAQLKGVSVYSLQKVNGADQIKELDPSITIHTFGDDFDEKHGRFMDTAAVIKNLDLVITIDTSISHFAAALGVPTWILLPEPADWRWMLNTNKTPWYPNVRLFRQPKMNDWKSSIQDVITALLELMQENHSHSKPTITITPNQIQASKISVEDLGELIDNLTLMQLEQNAQSSSDQKQELEKKYAALKKTNPEIELLYEQLFEVNAQLRSIDKKLQTSKQSVFNQDFIELSRKAYFAQDIKTYLKEKISALQSKKK